MAGPDGGVVFVLASGGERAAVFGVPFDGVEGACDGVESSREDDDVEVVMISIMGLDPRRCDLLCGSFLQVDEVDERFVESFEVT